MTALSTPADSLVNVPVVTGDDLGRRITRQLLLRTLVITAVLGLSVWLLANNQNPARVAIWLQSSLIAATYLSSIVFGVQLRRGVTPQTVARQMHANDIVLTTALVFITGGALSPYMFLYALTIVSAGALSYRRGAVVATVASLVAAITVALLAHTHALAFPVGQIRPQEQTWLDLFRTLGINFAALTGVGALSVIFGDQLQKSADTLASTRRAAADLLTLHQDIVRSLSSGLITITPDGTILSANLVAGEILRMPQDQLAGKPVDQVMPGVSVLIADNRQRADLAIPTPSHQMVMLGVTVSPLRDVHDVVIGRVINFQDLTDLRRLELHARRAERPSRAIAPPPATSSSPARPVARAATRRRCTPISASTTSASRPSPRPAACAAPRSATVSSSPSRRSRWTTRSISTWKIIQRPSFTRSC